MNKFTKSRTSRAPIIIGGVTFLSFKYGIQSYGLESEDGRASVRRNFDRPTYHAIVDKVTIGKRYLTEQAALLAAVKALKSGGVTEFTPLATTKDIGLE